MLKYPYPVTIHTILTPMPAWTREPSLSKPLAPSDLTCPTTLPPTPPRPHSSCAQNNSSLTLWTYLLSIEFCLRRTSARPMPLCSTWRTSLLSSDPHAAQLWTMVNSLMSQTLTLLLARSSQLQPRPEHVFTNQIWMLKASSTYFVKQLWFWIYP